MLCVDEENDLYGWNITKSRCACDGLSPVGVDDDKCKLMHDQSLLPIQGSKIMIEADMAARMEKWTSTEKSESGGTIKTSHFEVALSKVSPSVSAQQRQYYEDISKLLKAA